MSEALITPSKLASAIGVLATVTTLPTILAEATVSPATAVKLSFVLAPKSVACTDTPYLPVKSPVAAVNEPVLCLGVGALIVALPAFEAPLGPWIEIIVPSVPSFSVVSAVTVVFPAAIKSALLTETVNPGFKPSVAVAE